MIEIVCKFKFKYKAKTPLLAILPFVIFGNPAFASDLVSSNTQNQTDTSVTSSPQTNVISQDIISFFGGNRADFVSRTPKSSEVLDIRFSPKTSKFSVFSSSGDVISIFDPIDILNSADVIEALSLGDINDENFDVVITDTITSLSGFSGITATGAMIFEGSGYFLNSERRGTVYVCENCSPDTPDLSDDNQMSGDLISREPTPIDSINAPPENFLHTYGRVTVINPLTLEIEKDQLIAYTPEAFLFAQDRGLDVIQDYSDMVLIAQIPVPVAWSISADAIEATTGNIVVAAEPGNRVTINNGSVVITAAQERGDGNTISSSDGILYLGDSNQHRTIVRGTLEINDPTAPNHAATRRYVDAMGALAMSMATLPTPAPGKSMFGYSVGHINGESAFSAGFSHAPQHQGMAIRFNFGYSRATGVGGAIGFGHQW